MSHPIYSQSALSALSLADIKAIANSIGAICDGDKRSKQVWIDAIISHQIMFAPAKIEAMEAHIETVMNRAGKAEKLDEVATIRTSNDSDLDVDMPAHAEQEAIAHAADLLQPARAIALDDVNVIDYGTSSKPNSEHCANPRRGAVTVVLSAIVLLIVAVRSLLVGTCAIVRGAILLASMFGDYNPSLDFWWQFQQRAKHPPSTAEWGQQSGTADAIGTRYAV